MRISDWSSDVCSSDLAEQRSMGIVAEDVDQSPGVDRVDMLGIERQTGAGERIGDARIDRFQPLDRREEPQRAAACRLDQPRISQIGSASCRARVCPYE